MDTEAGNAELRNRVRGVRNEIAISMGFVIPEVRIHDNIQLAPNEYCIKFKGVAIGKANQVQLAIGKAETHARKNTVTFPIVGDTIPHEVIGRFGAASVWMKPAAPGTGVIAGAGVRLVLEAAGIKDVLAKSLGSTNPCNLVYATLEALKLLKSKEAVNVIRGKAEAVKAEEKPAAEVAAN